MRRIVENAVSVALGLALFALPAAGYYHLVVVPQQQSAKAQAFAAERGIRLEQLRAARIKQARDRADAIRAESRAIAEALDREFGLSVKQAEDPPGE